MTLGEKIAQLRKQRRMSQEELASIMLVSRQAVSKWEKGLSNPDTENLIQIAKIFEVDINILLGNQTIRANVCEETYSKEIENSKKQIRTLRLLLAIAVCAAFVLASIWLIAQSHARRNETIDNDQENRTTWDSIRIYTNHGAVTNEVELSQAERKEIADRIWMYCFSLKEDDAENDPPYGQLQIVAEFMRNGITYTWYFSESTISYHVLYEQDKTLHYRYQSDINLYNWLITYMY